MVVEVSEPRDREGAVVSGAASGDALHAGAICVGVGFLRPLEQRAEQQRDEEAGNASAGSSSGEQFARATVVATEG